jgi:hypothetical protein
MHLHLTARWAVGLFWNHIKVLTVDTRMSINPFIFKRYMFVIMFLIQAPSDHKRKEETKASVFNLHTPSTPDMEHFFVHFMTTVLLPVYTIKKVAIFHMDIDPTILLN